MASNLRVDNILPSSGVNLGIGTANGSVTFIGDTDISTTGSVTIAGNLGVGGTITYEDVARVDATGISTFREGFGVGPLTGIALTAYKDGSIRTSGIVTAASFDGSLATSNLTGTISTATSAATAYALDSAANITTGIITATAFIPSQGQLSHRNIMVNGAMNVAQRATSSTSDSYQTVDRFGIGFATGGITQAQVDLTSSDTPYASGFRKAYKLTNSTSSTAATAVRDIRYQIEAQDIACSGWDSTSTSSYITASFWVKSSVAQTYYVFHYVPDSTKHYVWSFALSANTWTKVTKTIPGASGVTINNDNGPGMSFQICAFYGTNFTASGVSLDTWDAWSGSNRTPDMTNTWGGTTNATFEVTGVQLEVGSVATPFEHRSYNDDLVQCERYYQTTYHGSTQDQPRMDLGFAASDTQVQSVHHYRTIMRDTPTPTQSGAFRVDGNTTKDVTSISFTYVSNVSSQVNYFTGAGLGGNNPYIIRGHSDADARLNFNAEL